MAEFIESATELLKNANAILAALIVALPLLAQAKTRAQGVAAEYARRRDEGLASLGPWVCRKAHEAFAAYKLMRAKSHPEKMLYIENLAIAEIRRKFGPEAISDEDIRKVVNSAKSFWSSNKLAMKAELAADPSNSLPALAGVNVDMSEEVGELRSLRGVPRPADGHEPDPGGAHEAVGGGEPGNG